MKKRPSLKPQPLVKPGSTEESEAEPLLNAKTIPSPKPDSEAENQAVGVVAGRVRGYALASSVGNKGYKAGGRKPASDIQDVTPVKISIYITPQQLRGLRLEVVKRLNNGIRSDVSALARSAIEAFLKTL